MPLPLGEGISSPQRPAIPTNGARLNRSPPNNLTSLPLPSTHPPPPQLSPSSIVVTYPYPLPVIPTLLIPYPLSNIQAATYLLPCWSFNPLNNNNSPCLFLPRILARFALSRRSLFAIASLAPFGRSPLSPAHSPLRSIASPNAAPLPPPSLGRWAAVCRWINGEVAGSN